MMRATVSEDEARKVIDLLASGEAMGQPTFFLAENLPDKAREIVEAATIHESRLLEMAKALRLPFIEAALAAGANLNHVSFQHHGNDWTVVSFKNAKGTYLLNGDDVYVTQASVQEAQAAIESDPAGVRGIKDLQLAGDIEIKVSEIRSTENKMESGNRVVEHSLSM